MTHAHSRSISALLFASCLLLTSALSALAAPPEKPNIIFILADDLGYADLACFGSSFYETPNLDRLARGGMKFTSAYAACPVCSPTRAALLTGKYPARLHLTDYIGGNRRGKLLPADYLNHLPLEEVTLAEALKEAGYTTGFFGKWHLGGPAFFPDRQGFDLNIGGCDKGSPPTYFSPYKIPTLVDGPKGEYLTDRLADEALKFLDTNKDKPFLLYLSHYAVHNPKQSKADLQKKFADKAAALPASKEPKFRPEGKRQDRRIQDDPAYAGMVQSVDESVGRIMEKLDSLKIAERTIIIFTSDNGGLSTSEGSPTSHAPLRAGKGWLYEGGIREPFIVKWPGVTAAGSSSDTPIISTDIYPTLLEMAGLPARPAQHLDGLSFAPLLNPTTARQPSPTSQREAIFWHYPHYGNQGGTPGGAIRAGDFKLIEFYEEDRVELYNLKDDLIERNDLASKMPEKAADLRARLHAWRKSVDATMTAPNPNYKPGQDPAPPAKEPPAKDPATIKASLDD